MSDRFTKKATPEKWRLLVQYLRAKVDEHDWHGVMDASADLRELEAANPKLSELNEINVPRR